MPPERSQRDGVPYLAPARVMPRLAPVSCATSPFSNTIRSSRIKFAPLRAAEPHRLPAGRPGRTDQRCRRAGGEGRRCQAVRMRLDLAYRTGPPVPQES